MKNEPTIGEVFLTSLAFRFFGKSVYKGYADQLPLSGNEKVLDFGSGMGTVAYYVAQRLTPGHGHLTCVDISRRWLAACSKTLRRFPGVSFLQGDVCGLPLPKESFDLIYCHFVLHDISDGELGKVLPVLVGLLKSKGLLAFREPLKETEKLKAVQRLLEEQEGLSKKENRVTDVPYMGNTLESIYIKAE
ncbi:MAG: class I SAM-dependent methyltransferase [Bacillota bacterium]|jgi:ubiquinone/menaquinone biosynthesis C-methylase UbiE